MGGVVVVVVGGGGCWVCVCVCGFRSFVRSFIVYCTTPKESVPCPPVLIRFAAHVGLFLRKIHGTCSRADELVEAYVKHLVRTRQTALVALYT